MCSEEGDMSEDDGFDVSSQNGSEKSKQLHDQHPGAAGSKSSCMGEPPAFCANPIDKLYLMQDAYFSGPDHP